MMKRKGTLFRMFVLVVFLLPFSLLNAANVGFVQGIWFNPDPFFANEAVRINTAIQNSEGLPAAGTMEVYLDDELLASKNFTVLDDDVALPSVIVTFPYGTHTIVAKISELNIVNGTTQTNVDVTDSLVSIALLIDNDTDGDGIGDLEDTDDDDDGFSDTQEITVGTDPLASSSNPVAELQSFSNNNSGSSGNSNSNNSSSNSNSNDDSSESTEEGEEEVATDTDGDGFSDTEEVEAGTNPDDAGDHPTSTDSDGDGFSNTEEAAAGTDPNNSSDHPTVNTSDGDGDGFSDVEEAAAGTDPNNAGDHPLSVDTDGDGFSDREEIAAGTDPDLAGDHPAAAGTDTDGDGFSDREEIAAGTDPASASDHPASVDTDGDGFSDTEEAAAGTDPNNAGDHSSASASDSDGDGFSDVEETFVGTNPNDAGDHPTSTDSDGDGFSDREEALAGTSSNNANDHPEAGSASEGNDSQVAQILSAALGAEETLRESIYQQLLAAQEALAQALSQNQVVNEYSESGVYSVSETGTVTVTDKNGISYQIDTQGNLIPVTDEGVPLNPDFGGNLVQTDSDGYIYYTSDEGVRAYLGTDGEEYPASNISELALLYPAAELLWTDQQGNIWAQSPTGETIGTEPLVNPFGLNTSLLEKLMSLAQLKENTSWFAHEGGGIFFNGDVSILSKTAYAVISTLRFFFSSVWLLLIFLTLCVLIIRKLYLLFRKYKNR